MNEIFTVPTICEPTICEKMLFPPKKHFTHWDGPKIYRFCQGPPAAPRERSRSRGRGHHVMLLKAIPYLMYTESIIILCDYYILSSNYYAKLHGIKLKLEWKCIHTSDFWRINCKSQANGNFEGFFFDLCREAKKQLQQLLKTAQHKMLATQQRGSKCWWSDTRYYEIQHICPNMMLYTTIPPSPSTPALQLHPHHDPLARSKKQSSVTGTAFQSGEYECSFRPSRKHYHSSWSIRNDFLAVRFKASEVDGVFCLVVSSIAKNYEL